MPHEEKKECRRVHINPTLCNYVYSSSIRSFTRYYNTKSVSA